MVASQEELFSMELATGNIKKLSLTEKENS
jgi:hypothetical protein